MTLHPPRIPRGRLAALLTAAFVLFALPGRAPVALGPHSTVAARSSLPDFSHVVVVVMENHEFDDIIGSSDAPYINSLADTYGLVTHGYAISHPSLPNYLAMLGGSTFGITDDCTTCHVHAWNLVDQLEAHGLSWKAYMEDMPRACFKGATRQGYAKRHDPFLYFDDIRNDDARCHRVVPFKELAQDLAAKSLPRFVFVTPNVCHDMHDCSVSTGDEFLQRRIPPILRALGSTGVLFLTWDEGHSSASCCRKAHGGHVVTIVAGPAAKQGARSSASYDTYSMLKTIELGWGLGPLQDAKCSCTRPLKPFFHS